MKTLIISVVLCYSLFAQENSDRQEFFMMTENTPVPVTFDLEKLGTTYCYYEDYIPITFEICEDCDPCNDCEGGVTIVRANGSLGYGWSICAEGGSLDFESYGWGVYKLLLQNYDKYFFIDFRDTRYGTDPIGGYGWDTKVLYNHSGFPTGEYFEWTPQYTGSGTDLTELIQTGSVAQIWKGNGYNYPNTFDFPNFWENCLVIGYHWYKNLQIIWSRNPNQYFIQKYYLYRKINNGSWYRIGVFNSQTFNYKDRSVKFNESYSNTASYRVKSYNGAESNYTNTAVLSSDIELDWDNGLILSVNDNNHPYFVWVPHPSFTTTHFKVYRAL